MFHQVVDPAIRVRDEVVRGGEELGEVVGRDLGGHPDRDPVGTVEQEVRETGRHDGWLEDMTIEVGLKGDSVLFDVVQQLQ